MISMKKIFNYLLIATLLISTAVSFNSCKDDDEEKYDEEKYDEEVYSIIGTWGSKYPDRMLYMTFQTDGTGFDRIDDGEPRTFTYTYKDNTLTRVYAYGPSSVKTVQWVDKNHFQTNDGDHWYRQ